ncbi:family 43 glycosylhydrolase [Clostridium tertium]
MKYNNHIIKGFYPDPSVCKVDDTYYLVCSSFQYFPDVPLFESKDLINWKQMGHCLTRKSQIQLDKINSSGVVFAPTIRYNNGRFYMTTTNNTTSQNFYVWTDNIYDEWSDPIYVDQGGIDPSLYFEDEKTYFMIGGYEIQGVGHGNLIEDNNGNWWLIHLGFRQSGQWEAYHHLGREVFLTPVTFGEDGWFTAGDNGTTTKSFNINQIDNDIVQNEKKRYTFENTNWNKEWSYLRIPNRENYKFTKNKLSLKGTEVTLDNVDSPTFIGLRQIDFNATISCDVCIVDGEAGITLYMDENHHYDLAIRKNENGYEVIKRLNIGDIKSVEKTVSLNDANKISLVIHASNSNYSFNIKSEDEEINLGTAKTRYLSSEVAGGFTGVIIGLYAYGESCYNYSEFTNFECRYL